MSPGSEHSVLRIATFFANFFPKLMTPEISSNHMRKFWEGVRGVLGFNDVRPQTTHRHHTSAPFCQFLFWPECSLFLHNSQKVTLSYMHVRILPDL